MRPLLLLLLLSIASVLLGRVFFQATDAIIVFYKYGYCFILINFLLFMGCFIAGYHRQIREAFNLESLRKHWLLFPTLAFCLLFTYRGSDMEYKTVMDEHIIASTARSMHYQRDLRAAMQMHNLNGVETNLFSIVDKRPVFFPFLVACLHDLFGYHPEHSLHLNVYILTPLFFIVLYLLGYRIAGPPAGALLAVLMATIPLIPTACSGGGLELLNLILLASCILFADAFVRKPTSINCGVLCFATILLANTRYESILFVLPVALLCFYVWYRARAVTVHWPLYLSPILLIPYLWQNQLFKMNDAAWQLEGKAVPFSFDYVQANFERSIHYFFNFDRGVANSWLVSIGGACAFIYFLLYLKRRFSSAGSADPMLVAVLVYVPAYLALYVLFLAYSWDFGTILIQRLSLPLNLPLLLFIVFAYQGFSRLKLARYGAYFAVGAYSLLYAYPSTSVRYYELYNASNLDYVGASSILESGLIEDDAIIIADNSFYFVLYGYPASPTVRANHSQAKIAWYIEQPIARPIYYFSSVKYDPEQGGFVNSMKHDLHEDYELELVAEEFISTMRKVEFSRIVGVRGHESPEDQDYDLNQFLKELGKKLP